MRRLAFPLVILLVGVAAPAAQAVPAAPRLTLDAAPVGISIPKNGAVAPATFTAKAGDRLAVVVRLGTLTAVDHVELTIRRPDGGEAIEDPGKIWSTTARPPTAAFDLYAPLSGTYTATLSADGHTGTATLQLVGATRQPATVGGPPVTVTVARPGQRSFVEFPATAGQRLTAIVHTGSVSTDDRIGITVRSPFGTTLASSSDFGYLPGKVLFTAPVTGRYSLETSPGDPATGIFTARLSGSSTVTAQVGGPAVPTRIPVPGERVFVRFQAAAGRAVTVVGRAGTLPAGYDSDVLLTIRAPDGGEIARPRIDGPGAVVSHTFTPAAAGRFEIEVEAENEGTGTLTVELR